MSGPMEEKKERLRVKLEVGQRYGSLLLVEATDVMQQKQRKWRCICDCGKETLVASGSLTNNRTKSCGCGQITFKHGKCRTHQYKMWTTSKRRALVAGHEFTIDVDDIVIPEYCPVLGLKLKQGKGKIADNSPSMDRVDNRKGYIKGNVQVISVRANRIKSDASLEELEKVLAYIKEYS